jgi:hypothetical protein
VTYAALCIARFVMLMLLLSIYGNRNHIRGSRNMLLQFSIGIALILLITFL